MSLPPPLTLRQKLALAAIVTIGAALRFETLGQTSLAHFDEGVLASGAFGVWLNGPFHFNLAQPLQSPPLFPWLVAAAHQATQTDWVIMGKMVSAAMAVATVPLLFLLGRRLRGNLFGLIAAGLLAASDLHVAYARMALTDAPLTFWFVLSIYCLLRLVEAPTLKGLAAWTAAAGLATGAAWNTKYNGWMPLAAVFAALLWGGFRDRMARSEPRALPEAPQGPRRLAVSLFVAALIAGVCFLPWYLFVDRSFAGGYRAVTENHLSYFGGPAVWPGRAWQLAVSLTALRHYGWLLSLAAAVIALPILGIRSWRSNEADGRRNRGLLVSSIVAVAGLFGGLVLGADLLLMLIGAAAIVPALVFGRWEQLLLAFWLGAFVVMTPLYHPYTRLLLPGLPAAICLSLWSLDAGWNLSRGSPDARRRLGQYSWAARLATSAAVLAGLTMFAAAHPFGWLPSSALWRRWSTRESYRSFGLAIDRHTPADALVLCQGLPPMPLYCPRRWLTLDLLPFTRLLPRAPAAAPCYLAVDDWGAHGEGHREALGTLIAQRSCLHRVAAVANDLNIVTLLDNLSPWEVAKKLRGDSAARGAPPPPPAANPKTGAEFLPPALREMGEDVIVLYRIDRACVDSHSLQ